MSLDASYNLVRQFHRTFSLPIADKPAALIAERIDSRSAWLLEEVRELREARSVEDQADALLDIIYLALGGFVELGMNPGNAFEIIHQSNMSKLWPDNCTRMSKEGKVIKPPIWHDPAEALRLEVQRQIEA